MKEKHIKEERKAVVLLLLLLLLLVTGRKIKNRKKRKNERIYTARTADIHLIYTKGGNIKGGGLGWGF
jgi:hypothetical protein